MLFLSDKTQDTDAEQAAEGRRVAERMTQAEGCLCALCVTPWPLRERFSPECPAPPEAWDALKP